MLKLLTLLVLKAVKMLVRKAVIMWLLKVLLGLRLSVGPLRLWGRGDTLGNEEGLGKSGREGRWWLQARIVHRIGRNFENTIDMRIQLGCRIRPRRNLETPCLGMVPQWTPFSQGSIGSSIG